MPIYLERGFKNNRIEVLQNTTNTFEWLASYEPKRITRKKDETDESYIKRIAELKPKQQYFISGYIEPNERGTVKRNNESLIRRDLITMTKSKPPAIHLKNASSNSYRILILLFIQQSGIQIPTHVLG